MKNAFTDIKSLGRIDSRKAMIHILMEWAIIFFCIFLYRYYIEYSILLLPLLVVIVGTRMYALYCLLHDGIHYLLLKDKKANDWVSGIFLAGPLFVSLSTMRRNHFKHHKYLLTENDPEFQLSMHSEFHFPLSGRKLLKIVLLDLTGVNFVKYRMYRVFSFFSKRGSFSGYLKPVIILAFCLLCMYLLYVIGLLDVMILLWLLPYITIYQLLNRLRAYTEHFNLPDGVDTRSLRLNPFLSFFISPYNLGYHEVHHRYPYIPHYHLNQLHEWVKVNESREIYEEVSFKRWIRNLWK